MSDKGKYYTWYSRRINKKYALARTNLESGMLLEINYKPEDDQARNYICLLLHKGHGGRLLKDKKVHLLAIENMMSTHFEDLVSEVGLEFSTYFKNVRKLRIEKLLMEQADSERFYISELKSDINDKFKNTYRTFNINRITLIKVLDFKFPDKLLKG